MPNLQHELMEFKFSPQFKPLRVEILNNEPWFAAKDICGALDLTNNRQAISNLDNDEKGVITTDTPGGPQKLIFVNESGLYNLIFQSRKPEAKKFRKWVTNEVLPSIRKTGQYGRPQIMNLTNLQSILELSEFVEKKIYEGEVYYAAVQLRRLFGKSRGGGCTVLFEKLSQRKEAIKIPPDNTNSKWWVKRSAIPAILNIKPTSLINISIIKSFGGNHEHTI
jgi:prophage antirepressor-like protein